MSEKLLDNPILQHKLADLRSASTPPERFRKLIGELAIELFMAAAQDLPLLDVSLETPLAPASGRKVAKPIALIPIMRAGNGMSDSIQAFWPKASVGHVGIYRDKFLQTTVEYYFKMPKGVAAAAVFVLDPIIATGDTAIATVSRLKENGCQDIRFLTILTSAQGRQALLSAHPDIDLYALVNDESLDPDGYLLPGVGDVGGRYYNTQ